MPSYKLHTTLGMLGWQGMVLDGEYALPAAAYNVLGAGWQAGHVLDIGANHGAFSVWALETYPECRVTGYEPIPSNREILQRSCAPYESRVSLFKGAVSIQALAELPMAVRPNGNPGEWRLVAPDTPGSVVVPNVQVKDLPACDWLKVDAEGAEQDIIPAYVRRDLLPAVVTYEYHTTVSLTTTAAALARAGYIPLSIEQGVNTPLGIGVAKWVRPIKR